MIEGLKVMGLLLALTSPVWLWFGATIVGRRIRRQRQREFLDKVLSEL